MSALSTPFCPKCGEPVGHAEGCFIQDEHGNPIQWSLTERYMVKPVQQRYRDRQLLRWWDHIVAYMHREVPLEPQPKPAPRDWDREHPDDDETL